MKGDSHNMFYHFNSKILENNSKKGQASAGAGLCKIKHISCNTDVTNSVSAEDTFARIRQSYKTAGGDYISPDIIVNSAGRLSKSCLTTKLSVSRRNVLIVECIKFNLC
mgnify:CR=1 FL=1